MADAPYDNVAAANTAIDAAITDETSPGGITTTDVGQVLRDLALRTFTGKAVLSLAVNTLDLDLEHNGSWIRMTDTEDISVLVTKNATVAWYDNSEVVIEQGDLGKVNLVADAGVTLTGTTHLAGPGDYLTLKRVSSDSWVAVLGQRKTVFDPIDYGAVYGGIQQAAIDGLTGTPFINGESITWSSGSGILCQTNSSTHAAFVVVSGSEPADDDTITCNGSGGTFDIDGSVSESGTYVDLQRVANTKAIFLAMRASADVMVLSNKPRRVDVTIAGIIETNSPIAACYFSDGQLATRDHEGLSAREDDEYAAGTYYDGDAVWVDGGSGYRSGDSATWLCLATTATSPSEGANWHECSIAIVPGLIAGASAPGSGIVCYGGRCAIRNGGPNIAPGWSDGTYRTLAPAGGTIRLSGDWRRTSTPMHRTRFEDLIIKNMSGTGPAIYINGGASAIQMNCARILCSTNDPDSAAFDSHECYGQKHYDLTASFSAGDGISLDHATNEAQFFGVVTVSNGGIGVKCVNGSGNGFFGVNTEKNASWNYYFTGRGHEITGYHERSFCKYVYEVGGTDVVEIDNTDSPYDWDPVVDGEVLDVDTTGGAVTVNLPPVANHLDELFIVYKYGSNDITLISDGSELIVNDTANKVLSDASGTYYRLECIDAATNGNWRGAASTLNGTLALAATSVVLADSSEFTRKGTALIENELITWGDKSGNTLTGLTRGYYETVDAEHTGNPAITQYPGRPALTSRWAMQTVTSSTHSEPYAPAGYASDPEEMSIRLCNALPKTVWGNDGIRAPQLPLPRYDAHIGLRDLMTAARMSTNEDEFWGLDVSGKYAQYGIPCVTGPNATNVAPTGHVQITMGMPDDRTYREGFINYEFPANWCQCTNTEMQVRLHPLQPIRQVVDNDWWDFQPKWQKFMWAIGDKLIFDIECVWSQSAVDTFLDALNPFRPSTQYQSNTRPYLMTIEGDGNTGDWLETGGNGKSIYLPPYNRHMTYRVTCTADSSMTEGPSGGLYLNIEPYERLRDHAAFSMRLTGFDMYVVSTAPLGLTESSHEDDYLVFNDDSGAVMFGGGNIHLNADAGAVTATSTYDGQNMGDRLSILNVTGDTTESTVSASGTTYTFNATNEYVILEWNGVGWVKLAGTAT